MTSDLEASLKRLKAIGDSDPTANKQLEKQLGKVRASRIALEKFTNQLERKQGPVRIVEVRSPYPRLVTSVSQGSSATEMTNTTKN